MNDILYNNIRTHLRSTVFTAIQVLKQEKKRKLFKACLIAKIPLINISGRLFLSHCYHTTRRILKVLASAPPLTCATASRDLPHASTRHLPGSKKSSIKLAIDIEKTLL